MSTRRIAAAVIVGAAGPVAIAGTVYINPSVSQVTATETAGRGEARYRLTSNNWDQALLNGSPGGNREINNELGNAQTLSNVWFRYTLSHEAGQGYTMTMVKHGTLQTNPAGTSHTLIWRGDSTNLNNGGSPTSVDSVQQLNGQTVATNGAVHMLLLNVQATSPGGSMVWDQLSFTASGQTIIGVLGDMNAPPSATQRIVSTTDFRTFDWQLDGWVKGTVATTGEAQKFWVNFKDGEVSVIPLPTTAGLAGLGLLTLGARRRRSA